MQIKKNEPLGVIIPIVYYHGKSIWKIKGINEFFTETPLNLTNFIPEFDMVFVDLNQLSDEALLGLQDNMLSAALSIQKYSYNPGRLWMEFGRIMTTISRYGSGNFFNQSIVYCLQLTDKEPEQIMQLTENLEGKLKQKVMTTYEKFIARGIEQGIELGIELGIEQGMEKKEFEMILKGLENGHSVDLLSNITGVSKERILEIAKTLDS